MNKCENDPLRAWFVPENALSYVLATMGLEISFWVVNVFQVEDGFMVLFRGSYPFVENQMKETMPGINDRLYGKKSNNN